MGGFTPIQELDMVAPGLLIDAVKNREFTFENQNASDLLSNLLITNSRQDAVIDDITNGALINLQNRRLRALRAC